MIAPNRAPLLSLLPCAGWCDTTQHSIEHVDVYPGLLLGYRGSREDVNCRYFVCSCFHCTFHAFTIHSLRIATTLLGHLVSSAEPAVCLLHQCEANTTFAQLVASLILQAL